MTISVAQLSTLIEYPDEDGKPIDKTKTASPRGRGDLEEIR